MKEWQKNAIWLRLARLGLIQVLVAIVLWAWPVAEAPLRAGPARSQPLAALTQPSLSTSKEVTPTLDIPYHGTATYTVVLDNGGIVSDTGVLLSDTLPVEVDFARWAPGGQPPGAVVVNDELTWQGTVTAGQALTFTFVVSHVGDYGDVVTNTARFSGTQQAGADSATFAVAGRMTYTVHLPLLVRPSEILVAATYGGPDYDKAWAIQQTADGGYVVAGDTTSFEAGAWVLKLHADGSLAWQKAYGGAGYTSAHAMQQTADGGYVVAGSTWTDLADAWVQKLHSDGSVDWQKHYAGGYSESVYAIQQTADGGYILLGATGFPISAFVPYGWVLKLDAHGDVTWRKTFGWTNDNSIRAIQQTSDGGYIVAGSIEVGWYGPDHARVLKLDVDGNVVWQKTYSGESSEYALAIQQTADGGYIVAGYTASFGAGSWDAWVLRLNADASVAWQKTYGGADMDYAFAIQQTANGGYVVAGKTKSFGAGDHDAWVLGLNADGSVAWQKTYGGAGYDDAGAIQQTADGGYVVTGYTESFGAGGGDFWVLKLDAEGGFCEGCPLGEDTNVLPADSDGVVSDIDAPAGPSDAVPVASDAIVVDTDVVPNPICVCPLSLCGRLE